MDSLSIEEVCADPFLIDWIGAYENNQFAEVEQSFSAFLNEQGQAFTLAEAFELLDLYKSKVTKQILLSIAVDDVGSLVGLEFYKAAPDEMSSPRVCLILNGDKQGTLKLTHYDVYGPIGHEYRSDENPKILADLLMQGFNSVRPGVLDAFTDLPTWKVC
jgi:hypothetical protein